MPTRLTSGVTLDMVHLALWRKVDSAQVVPTSATYPVIDDEVAPVKQPPFQRFITVRHPPLEWAHGDVMGGGGNLSKLHCQGNARVTLWLKHQGDIWGRFDEAAKEALAPEGGSLIGRLMLALWEQELTDGNGDYLLKRPLKFAGYEPPGPGRDDWRPFRMNWEVEFEWDLSTGG